MRQLDMTDSAFQSTAENRSLHRFHAAKDSVSVPLSALLSKYHNKKIQACIVKNKPINLHGGASSERSTVLVEIIIDSVSFKFPLSGCSKGKHRASRSEEAQKLEHRFRKLFA